MRWSAGALLSTRAHKSFTTAFDDPWTSWTCCSWLQGTPRARMLGLTSTGGIWKSGRCVWLRVCDYLCMCEGGRAEGVCGCGCVIICVCVRGGRAEGVCGCGCGFICVCTHALHDHSQTQVPGSVEVKQISKTQQCTVQSTILEASR